MKGGAAISPCREEEEKELHILLIGGANTKDWSIKQSGADPQEGEELNPQIP